MSRFENFLEACDGSGKMDGKGKKKQKRKGKDQTMGLKEHIERFNEASKSKKPLRVFANKEYGIEAHVGVKWGDENMEGYTVKLKDTDANKFIEVTKIFPNEKDANDYAKYLVKKY